MPAPDDQTLPALEAHATAVAHLSKRPTGARLLAATSGWEMLAPRLEESIETGRKLQKSRATLEERYTNELFALDLREARRKFGRWGDAFFLIAFFMLWSVRRQLRGATKDGNLPDNDHITEHLEAAIGVGELEDKLSGQSVPSELEGTLWQGASTDWELLDEASQWTDAYRQRLSSLAARESWSQLAQQEVLPWQSGGEFVEAYRSAVARLSDAYAAVVETTGFDQEAALGSDARLDRLDATVADWRESFDELRPWSLYLRARDGDSVLIGLETFYWQYDKDVVGELNPICAHIDVVEEPTAPNPGYEYTVTYREDPSAYVIEDGPGHETRYGPDTQTCNPGDAVYKIEANKPNWSNLFKSVTIYCRRHTLNTTTLPYSMSSSTSDSSVLTFGFPGGTTQDASRCGANQAGIGLELGANRAYVGDGHYNVGTTYIRMLCQDLELNTTSSP